MLSIYRQEYGAHKVQQLRQEERLGLRVLFSSRDANI